MNKKFKYAPIIIPTLNRYEHLKRCVTSLSKNSLAKETELVIGLDYPPNEKYVDGYKKVKEYVKTITGFAKVTILTTDVNLNATGNHRRLIEYVKSQNYETFIATEDDNEFSPIFLEYIDWGLKRFKDDEDIFSINGFNIFENIDDLPNNVFKCQSFSAWGYGTWIKKYSELNEFRDLDLMRKIVNNISIFNIFSPFKKSTIFEASSFILMLKKKYILGDVLMNSLYKRHKNIRCIYPKKSLVRNWGSDGSGLHGSGKKLQDCFSSMNLDDGEHFNVEDDVNIPILNPRKNNLKAKNTNQSFLYKLYLYMIFVFYKLGLYIDIKKVH